MKEVSLWADDDDYYYSDDQMASKELYVCTKLSIPFYHFFKIFQLASAAQIQTLI